MRRRTTIYGVAEMAGVSVATVSRVVRGLPGVSERTAAAVRAAVAQLEYVPSGSAQSLASRRTGVIGLIFPDLDDPTSDSGHETLLYCDEVIRGAERAARLSGRAILIAATHRSSDPALVSSVAAKVDGLVILARSVAGPELRTLASQMPVVLLAGRRSIPNADLVSADNEGGCHTITSHLIKDHGCRNLVFLAGPPDSPDGTTRMAGFKRAMAEGGLEVTQSNIWRGNFTEAAGRRAAYELFAKKIGLRNADHSTASRSSGDNLKSKMGIPDGLVAGNDQMAIGATTALSELGLAVPGDVAVGGFDDIQLSRLVTPSLTTVRQPMRDLGKQSVEMLVERLSGARSTRKVATLATQLVVRASCGCEIEQSGLSQGRLSRSLNNTPDSHRRLSELSQ